MRGACLVPKNLCHTCFFNKHLWQLSQAKQILSSSVYRKSSLSQILELEDDSIRSCLRRSLFPLPLWSWQVSIRLLKHGYTSIPTGIYWAITTMTTVGFGDIAPQTDLGGFLSSVMMLIGWGTLAVPTEIVTAEMSVHAKRARGIKTCPQCLRTNLKPYDKFCGTCGHTVDVTTLTQ